ncbi:hypothetical protein NDU88_007631 [Pleurodeles waltl]|uniref:Uncharacterized protein n=1 Tax=Pleurodeles waltl TaxID=8319 RepID=A0AAV7NTN9_PLEWA|nr:hypothetical protein NDU88_007631 [Pleurodeles waltl]
MKGNLEEEVREQERRGGLSLAIDAPDTTDAPAAPTGILEDERRSDEGIHPIAQVTASNQFEALSAFDELAQASQQGPGSRHGQGRERGRAREAMPVLDFSACQACRMSARSVSPFPCCKVQKVAMDRERAPKLREEALLNLKSQAEYHLQAKVACRLHEAVCV